MEAGSLGIEGVSDFKDKEDVSVHGTEGGLRGLDSWKRYGGECFQHLEVALSGHQAICHPLFPDDAGGKVHSLVTLVRHGHGKCYCPGEDNSLFPDL